ncbi:MAG TPA: DNA polymerase III subunit alpha, partial [Prevotellaceae bacterium]|nr:DNA polymerase III subunit alpha [Prevotellaceae bacterium]
LSEMKEACRVIKEAHGVDIDLDRLPIDDAKTYELYQKGRTVGTFQFESAGMQKYLKELHPTVFEDLIAMNALYRPGPMDYIPSFIARKNGREEIKYDIPIMEKYLKDTYGITVYQEQVMLLSRLLANFTRGESDALRKAMGKKKKDIVDAMKPKFIEGGVKNGHDPKVLEKIWGDWEKFASYAFNKSHAACYSWVAYQTAYLKAHYPPEFMAALLTRRKDDIKETAKLLDECHQMGIEVLGPDVNESHPDFGVNAKGQIRYGLTAIKGLGEAAAVAIVREREKGGAYRDVFDFVQRVSLPAVKKSGLECLALSGAFDTLGGVTREQFFAPTFKDGLFVEALLKFGTQYQQSKAEAACSLFGFDEVEVTTPAVPAAEPWGALERLNKEKQLIGIYLSAHPLDEYMVILKKVCNLQVAQLENLTPLAGHEVRLGGIVTALRKGVTKKGKPYGIVTLEDYSGAGEIPLFGENWARFGSYMETPGTTVYVTGRVQGKRFAPDEMELSIGNVQFLDSVKDSLVENITIHLPEAAVSEDLAVQMGEAVSKHPGRTDLLVNIIDAENGIPVCLHRRRGGITVTKQLLEILDNNNIPYTINQ